MNKTELRAYSKDVAKRLSEKDHTPIRQIEMLVEAVGKDFVEEQLARTLAIEEEGGMKTEDNTRRRTPGGVFFYLVKGALDTEIRQRIFPNVGQMKKGRVLEWQDRSELVDKLMDANKHGELKFAKTEIQGLPGEIELLENSVVTTIEYKVPNTPFPRGVPRPPEQEFVYTVYMAIKHWDAVKESLEKYKSDRLIIEGLALWDKDLETMSIFATRVSTRKMEKIQRQKDEAAKLNELKEKIREEVKQELAASVPSTPTTTEPPPAEERYVAQEPPIRDDIVMDIPAAATPDQASKLRSLYSAAATLKDRIEQMQAEGKGGVKMTEAVLRRTEKQIETLINKIKS